MANWHWLTRGVLLLSLAAALGAQPLAAGAQAETGSGQFTQPDAVNPDWQTNQVIPATYALMAENASFQLYADAATLAFKVVDKRSGYVWHSNLDETTADDKLNKTWTAFARSGISLEYLDPKAVDKRLSITNAEHTLDFQRTDQGFAAQVRFDEVGITVGVVVQLEAAGVRVEVPFASVKQEDPDYKLGTLYVYPFLGATKLDSIPGYMFIPDGVGSLIRFSAVTKAQNMYYGRYYGDDLGMLAYLPWDPTINRAYRLSVPVFGMVHGYHQNAFLAVLEQGAGYGELQAHPAGVITKFNFLYNAFIYNESYFQATNRSGAGVTTLQRETNAFDVRVHYRFLTGADSDYVGLARSYQQYLADQGELKRVTRPAGDIGVRLEFLGGEKEKILFWNRLIPMTTITQMAAILRDLALPNPDVVYYGWQPLGASSMPPTTLKLDGGLGTLAQLSALSEQVGAAGGQLALYWDPQAAVRDEAGYSTRSDLAMAITNVNLIGYNRGKVNYYFNWETLSRRFGSLSREVAAQPQLGLALDGIGATVYSDFKPGHRLTREAAIQRNRQLLTESGGPYALYQPNNYLFPAMRAYYDMPLGTSGYLYTTDTVPFLPIVLAGYVPAYGPALNFSSNSQEDLLRLVDYGVYPAYFLSQEATGKILNSASNWIYTSSYAQWGAEIKRSYDWLNSRLGPVAGQPITARQVLAPGVVAVTYGTGRQIIVNYNEQPFAAGGVVVNGKDAVLREVAP